MSERTRGPPHAVRKLTPDLFPSAAELLAEAFFDNPAHLYFCPDEKRRFAQLVWLLGGNLHLQPDLTASFCLVEDGIVQAMGFWTRSDTPPVGTWRKLRSGILQVPFRLGWTGTRRVFEVTATVERQLERVMRHRPYWYLNNMVVRAQLRGTGVGSRLLRAQLEIVTKAEPSFAIVLATQRPENVTFYRRLGFEPVLDAMVGSGPRAFRTWLMEHSRSRFPATP